MKRDPMIDTITATKQSNDVKDLWIRYRETRNERDREQIVLQYVPLVKYVVGRMFSHLPIHVSREELMSCGVMGLIDAVERYDPARGVKFETFAVPRIRGSILDELRSYDLLPRMKRMKIKEIQEIIHHLEGEYGRSPTDEEIADRLNITVEKYHHLLKDLSPIRFFSLADGLNVEGDWRIQMEAVLKSPNVFSPDSGTENREMRKVLVNAIRKLPKNERLLIALYYYEEMTMKEIGMVLKVSESRVSQIHTQALLKLRNAVESVMHA